MPVLSLTIYNDGAALIKERRTLELVAGINTIELTDIPSTIEGSSLSFVSLSDPDGTTVLEQSFEQNQIDTLALLRHYHQPVVTVRLHDGREIVGELLTGNRTSPFGSSLPNLIIREPDGQFININGSSLVSIELPGLQENIPLKPTLRWVIQSARGGTQEVEITYLAKGISWHAAYNALLSRDNHSIKLDGWVTLSNTTNITFDDVLVTLVGGETEHNPEESSSSSGGGSLLRRIGSNAPAAKRDSKYFSYDLPRPLTLRSNETKQVKLVAGETAAIEARYTFDASPEAQLYGNTTRHFFNPNPGGMSCWLHFATTQRDLPAGLLRIYQDNAQGAAVVIREIELHHTPAGHSMRFQLGKGVDITGERSQTQFDFNAATGRLEETYEIRLHSHQAAVVTVTERMFRGEEWELTHTSHDYTTIDRRTVEFHVPVEGETVLIYTVQYQHAMNRFD